MYLLFLDDERILGDVTWIDYPAYYGVYVERNVSDFMNTFCSLMENGVDFEISFDHDLQDFSRGYELTGYTAVKMMVDTCFENGYDIPVCYYHTQNPIGRESMEAYVNNARLFSERLGR